MSDTKECDPGREVPDGLFKHVKYFLVGSVASSVERLLNAGGAKKESYLTEMVTHAIAEDDTDYSFSEAKELFEIPVVTSRWVVLSIKCAVLLPTDGFNPESGQTFSNLVICPSQLSVEDEKAVWTLVTHQGGVCKSLLDVSVTHLVVTQSSGPKYEAALQHGDRIKIVTPDWIMDCAQQKVKLSESLYHPRLLLSEEEIQASNAKLAAVKEEVKDEDLDPYGMPMSPQYSTPTTSTHLIFKSDSTRTKEALARMVTNRISQGGKERPVLDPSMLMSGKTDFAPPPEVQSPPPSLPSPSTPQMPPVRPLGAPRAPGSPRGAGSPRGPRSPRVRGAGSPRGGARGQLRNITNSTDGRAPRSPRGTGRGRGSRGGKMGHMAAAMNHPFHPPFMPGPFPPSLQFGPGGMPPAPSIAYYGHDPSETVPETLCLVGCVFYITDYHKYIALQELENWKQVIEQKGGQVDDSYSNRVTHVLCEHQKSDVFQLALRDGKRVVTAHWLNDCLIMKKMQPPWLVLHFPSPYGMDRPCKNQIITITNFDGDDRVRVKHMINMTGARYTGYLTRTNSVLIAKRPEGVKYHKACEWKIPVVNVQWLNNLLLGDMLALKLPLHLKYQHFGGDECFKIAERWRVGHMMEGWKIPIKLSKDIWKKFHPSQFLSITPPERIGAILPQPDGPPGGGSVKRPAENNENQGLPPEKRLRAEDGSVLTEQHVNGVDAPVILITGVPKRYADLLAANVRKLGGIVTENPKNSTHLVALCIARTMKFFLAFSVVKYIVSPDWITQSLKAGRFLDEADFYLKDEKNEQEINFNLQESLRRMREKQLFKDYRFYITPSVRPKEDQLADIVQGCGGQVLKRRPTLRTIVSSRTLQGKPSLVVITCENDLHICRDMKKKNIALHNAEFILTGIIKQEINYQAYRY